MTSRVSNRAVTNKNDYVSCIARNCLSPSYPYSRGARLLNTVKRGALLAPKEAVIKNSISFLSACLFKNGETKTAVVGPFVYVVICKNLGF